MAPQDDKREACKTYVEQTKLLVTLASAFVIAPAALLGLAKGDGPVRISQEQWHWEVWAEMCFVASVCLGYVVLGTIAGSQDDGSYDVFRRATRWTSIIQFATYIVGVVLTFSFINAVLVR